MSRMDYYSNELDDNFIEIDDTISNEEYHFSEVKEKKKEDKIPYYDDWHKNTIMSCQPAILYAEPWQAINQGIEAQQCVRQDRNCILDAQQYNGYQSLANACQTQQLIANPTDFIQQHLNTSCNNIENSLRNLYDTISKIMED